MYRDVSLKLPEITKTLDLHIYFQYLTYMKLSYVYIIECADTTYYTGVTSDITQRFERHQSGAFPNCYTYSRRPLKLVFYAEFTSITQAIDTEKQIKKWSRKKKEALIQNDFSALENLAKKKF